MDGAVALAPPVIVEYGITGTLVIVELPEGLVTVTVTVFCGPEEVALLEDVTVE